MGKRIIIPMECACYGSTFILGVNINNLQMLTLHLISIPKIILSECSCLLGFTAYETLGKMIF
jgi:hypothetical protein